MRTFGALRGSFGRRDALARERGITAGPPTLSGQGNRHHLAPCQAMAGALHGASSAHAMYGLHFRGGRQRKGALATDMALVTGIGADLTPAASQLLVPEPEHPGPC